METVDRVLTEYSQSPLTVGPESEYAIATEMVSGIRHQLSPKKKSEGETGKTVKTHFIASAALSATAAWELLTPLSDCPWAVPVPKVT